MQYGPPPTTSPAPPTLPPTPIATPTRWHDDLNPLFILIVALGVVGALILSAGAIEFIVFEPLGQASGMKARIEGAYRYNTHTGRIFGKSQDHFTEDQAFAAVVDWKSLPADTELAARWFNSFGQEVGGVGPDKAGDLAGKGRGIVPAALPKGLDKNLPGHYLFVIERYVNGMPAEVVGRVIVLVQRG